MIIPYYGGNFKIVIQEQNTEDTVFEFLNSKCNFTIPILSYEEKKAIRKTSIIPTYTKVSLAIWVVDLFIFVLGYIVEGCSGSWFRYYLTSFVGERAQGHVFFGLGMFLFLLGLLLGGFSKSKACKALASYDIFEI